MFDQTFLDFFLLYLSTKKPLNLNLMNKEIAEHKIEKNAKASKSQISVEEK